MTVMAPTVENLTLNLTEEIRVRASLEATFAALLEIIGPLFMSYPVVSNLQYRLTPVEGGTLIAFRHTALGFVLDEHRQGLSKGWTPLHERVRARAEASGR